MKENLISEFSHYENPAKLKKKIKKEFKHLVNEIILG